MADPRIADLSDLRGKVALVTGSAAGIGHTCALRLAEAGARVSGFDADGDGAEATAQLVGSDDAMATTGDVRRRADVEGAAAATLDRWGRMDVVVNCAGLFPPSPVLEISDELWDTVVGVNAGGTFLVSQVCAPHLAAAGGGAIVNIASKSSFQPSRGFAHYAASKGAVAMITKALALELAPLSIRVNAVAPGSVATETARRAGQAVVAFQGEEAMARSSRCPMGRSAAPDEIARVVLFLASDWSTFMTGSVVVADGGFLVS